MVNVKECQSIVFVFKCAEIVVLCEPVTTTAGNCPA